jgi:4-hydroxythreonine-4-phosphate dehydrogenase
MNTPAPSHPTTSTPIALTMGEPAGIGGEISLLAWLNRDSSTPCYFVIDDPDRLSALARSLDLDVPVKTINQPADAAGVFPTALPVLAESIEVSVQPGQPNKKAAPAILRSIDRAVELVERGEAAAMVTNPIHKATLMAAGFDHPGHTEYLAERTGAVTPPVMMLSCSQLRVVLSSIHLPLKDALAQLTTAAIIHCGRITAAALARDFGAPSPRLAVAGLNPHAGEQGYLGREEIDIIIPAIEQLQSDGLTVTGPFPADTMFHEAARQQYDAAICLYHDQALIPIKTIDFDGGVNISLGIPIVRTSPDHGTAFDIAGTGRASPRSLLAALTQARIMADHRTRFDAEHDSA